MTIRSALRFPDSDSNDLLFGTMFLMWLFFSFYFLLFPLIDPTATYVVESNKVRKQSWIPWLNRTIDFTDIAELRTIHVSRFPTFWRVKDKSGRVILRVIDSAGTEGLIKAINRNYPSNLIPIKPLSKSEAKTREFINKLSTSRTESGPFAKYFWMAMTGLLFVDAIFIFLNSTALNISAIWGLYAFLPMLVLGALSKLTPDLIANHAMRFRYWVLSIVMMPIIAWLTVLGLAGYLNEKLDSGEEQIRDCTFTFTMKSRLCSGSSKVEFNECPSQCFNDIPENLPPGTSLKAGIKPGFFGLPWMSRLEAPPLQDSKSN